MREREPDEQKNLEEYGRGKHGAESAAGDGSGSSQGEEERESFSFLKETIKPKPVTRGQITLQIVKSAVCGLIIGAAACCGFYALQPWAKETFHEDAQEVTLPADEEEETEPSEEAAGEEADQGSDAEPEPEPEPEVIFPDLTADSYREIMQSMYAIAREAEKCVVSVRASKKEDSRNETGAHHGATGLVAADNGQELLIFADNSVCEGAEQWTVVFSDHTQYQARLVKQDGNRGLAVFGVERASIEASTWNAAQVADLGNSNITARGDVVIALGEMFGYENGLGYGIIGSKEWNYTYADGQCGVITTDIAAAPGGSGVLFNQKGQVIGLVKSGILGDAMSASSNALAISDLKMVMEMLLNGDSVAYTGISGISVTEELSEEQKIPRGLYVTNVQVDSPAMKAGIQNGDVIQKVGEDSVTGIVSYEKAVLRCKPGEAVKVKGQRLGNGSYVDVDFTVTAGSIE